MALFLIFPLRRVQIENLRGRFFQSNMDHVRVHPILRMSHLPSTPNLFPGLDPCWFPIATFPVGADDSTSMQTLKPSIPYYQIERYAQDLRWIFFFSSPFDWFTQRRTKTMPSIFTISRQSRLGFTDSSFSDHVVSLDKLGNLRHSGSHLQFFSLPDILMGRQVDTDFWTNNADEQWYAAAEELVITCLVDLPLSIRPSRVSAVLQWLLRSITLL